MIGTIPLLVKEPLQHIFRIRNWVQHHAPVTIFPHQEPLILTGQRAGRAPWLIWNGWRRNITASPPGIEPRFPNHSARSLVTKLTELSDSCFIGGHVFKAAVRFVWLQGTNVRVAQSHIHWQAKIGLNHYSQNWTLTKAMTAENSTQSPPTYYIKFQNYVFSIRCTFGFRFIIQPLVHKYLVNTRMHRTCRTS